MKIDRRSLIKVGAVGLGGSVLGLGGLMARAQLTPDRLRRGAGNSVQSGGYGPITARPSVNTGQTVLALPEGFHYTVFGRTGDLMSDGRATPNAHDGMAAFDADGRIRLIRNHEVRSAPGSPIGPTGSSYDPVAGGGTTTLDVDPVSRLPLFSAVSLSGTLVNCAGGPTPWGTWITCEETVNGTGQGYQRNHGYCFEVSASKPSLNDPAPIRGMGRFVHEAVAVDPATGYVYETEDRSTAGFYRFVPTVPRRLHSGGRLQMLAVQGAPQLDTRTGQTVGQVRNCAWVDIGDPDPVSNATSAVYSEGLGKGGATFARLEGCWWGGGSCFFTATNGGNARLGQVWRYTPTGLATGTLTLLFESTDANVLDGPDNCCVSPRGALAICEDGGGANFVRGLTSGGLMFDFLRNVLNDSEFAGACFSPDGQTMFVNIQSPGLTLAVWGDWARGSF